MASGDPLEESAGGASPAAITGRSERARCEFCECKLTTRGEVLEFSEKAKKLRKADEHLAELQGTLDTRTQELEDARVKIRQLEEGRAGDPSRSHYPNPFQK
jgi:hypothetical protein